MQLEFHQLDRRWEHLRVRRPDQQRRLLASLAASGQQTPIVVVAVAGQPDRYLVIDGYQRLAALEQLGRDTVEAVDWPMQEAAAVMLEHAIRMSPRATALEEGWLLAELEQRFGYGLEELARRFDRSTGWVSRRLALAEMLPESVQERVRSGAITAHIAMKFLAPIAQVNREHCQRMAEAFARHKCQTREAGQLYAAWRDASPSIRQRILEEPELFLKTQRQREHSPLAASSAAALLHDLETLTAIASQASRRLGSGVEMNGNQCEEARRKIDRAMDQLSRLAAKIPRKEEAHVEPQSTRHDSGAAQSGSAHPPDRALNESLPFDGAPGPADELGGCAGAGASREGRALPAADPGTAAGLQGESGAGP